MIAGLKASPLLNKIYTDNNIIYHENDIFVGEHKFEKINELIEKQNSNHITYYHASCAVSKIIGAYDYNGTMFRSKICSLFKNGLSNCEETQMEICNKFKKNIERKINDNSFWEEAKEVIGHENFELLSDFLNIHQPIYQEDLIYITQRLKFPVKSENIIRTNQYFGSILIND